MPYKDKNQEKEAHRRNYLKTKETFYNRNKARRAERKVWFFETFLSGKTCEKCPESDPACLDFHHIDPSTKDGTISRMVNEFRSKESIALEVAKCMVICANCHRKLHASMI